jgi:hypothetical protein
MRNESTFIEKICEIMVKREIISPKEAEALKKDFKQRSHISFDNFLLEEGLVEKSDLLIALSDYYQVPAFDVMGHFFNHILVTQFPKDFLIRNGIIPLDTEGDNILIMVAATPDDEELPARIGKYVSYEVYFMVGIYEDIVEAINDYYDESITMVYNDDSNQDLIDTPDETLDEALDEIERENK